MVEKRSEKRFKISQLIGYYPSREEYLWAEGIDISRHGVHCRSSKPVDPLTNVFIMLEVKVGEEKRLVRCEGFVAHSRMVEGKCEFGIKFEHISSEDMPLFETFLSSIGTEGESPDPILGV
jgi:hypothetical protein